MTDPIHPVIFGTGESRTYGPGELEREEHREEVRRLDATIAALRKRMTIDDAMIARAEKVFWADRPGNWSETMRAALEAAIGEDGHAT